MWYSVQISGGCSGKSESWRPEANSGCYLLTSVGEQRRYYESRVLMSRGRDEEGDDLSQSITRSMAQGGVTERTWGDNTKLYLDLLCLLLFAVELQIKNWIYSVSLSQKTAKKLNASSVCSVSQPVYIPKKLHNNIKINFFSNLPYVKLNDELNDVSLLQETKAANWSRKVRTFFLHLCGLAEFIFASSSFQLKSQQ